MATGGEQEQATTFKRVTWQGQRCWIHRHIGARGSPIAPEHHVKDGELDPATCFDGQTLAHIWPDEPEPHISRFGAKVGVLSDITDGWPE